MQTTRKLLITFTALVFMLVATAGIVSTMMTDDHSGMMMSGCPFMGEAGSLCQMSIFEHIAKWQSLFVATMSFNMILLLFVVVVFSLFSRALAHALAPPDTVSKYHEPPDITFFKPLLAAFSRGIIQPKLYA